MRAPEKKKAYKRAIKAAAKAGMINRADGTMVPKASLPESSMRRDYMPNR